MTEASPTEYRCAQCGARFLTPSGAVHHALIEGHGTQMKGTLLTEPRVSMAALFDPKPKSKTKPWTRADVDAWMARAYP